MGLKVYKGQNAVRQYENAFFRELAGFLTDMFEKEKRNGILIGFPTVPGNSHIQPDCLLVTPTRLVIIDFKNYGNECKLKLPDEKFFRSAKWMTSSYVEVKGGSKVNPFVQLEDQKNHIQELIGPNSYDDYWIACVVCFQRDLQIVNSVPGKFQSWFSVTNGCKYLNQIRDTIDIKTNNPIDINEIRKYFEAEEYNDYTRLNVADIDKLAEENFRVDKLQNQVETAKEEVTKLKRELKVANSNAAKAKDLEAATERFRKAKDAFDKEKKSFDDNKHLLDIEIAKENTARANAVAAKAKAMEAQANLQKEEIKSKEATKKVIGGLIFVIAIACVLGFFIWSHIQKNNEEAERIEAENARLESDYRAGRQCIPVERVAEFNGSKNVCVDFIAGYINDSKYYTFIDNSKTGNFAIMASKKILTEVDASAMYLHKHIQVRGDIEEYNGTYEIKITDLNQIKIIEDN